MGRLGQPETPIQVMKVYVRGKSLREINEGLSQGKTYPVKEYSLLRHGIEFTLGDDVPDGSEVAVFARIQNGFPYAHVMGRYCSQRNRVLRHSLKPRR